MSLDRITLTFPESVGVLLLSVSTRGFTNDRVPRVPTLHPGLNLLLASMTSASPSTRRCKVSHSFRFILEVVLADLAGRPVL